MKKVILIVLDSLGVGALPDSRKFGDDNPHTLQSLYLRHPGIITVEPLATYPTGFPAEMLAPFVKYLGTDILGNENASGTEIIERLGREHMLTG